MLRWHRYVTAHTLCCSGSLHVLNRLVYVAADDIQTPPPVLQGAKVHPTTALLMVGVLLSGYSTYLSYTYLIKVRGQGLDILQGWTQLKAFNEHLLVNFVGAAATVLALQAEVGIMMVGGMTKSAGGLGLAALAQVRRLS
eukprot:GHRQ01021018.1.p1 GENE.GHRQ01021018.1~~GHRQ01021018.1.p1  ORF type:complete len:140 (-),score=53.64 GHRQ01021018.1:50-469(-)